MERVLVTGCTGFIGLHCVVQLISKGFKVRGTLRSVKRKSEVVGALLNAGLSTDNLEFVEINLLDDSGWLEAVKDCAYVLHVASPTSSTLEGDMVKIAVEGTKRVLWACSRANIKKIVITSSLAAVTGCDISEKKFNERDWADPLDPEIDAYTKSKVAAELAAWDFMSHISPLCKMKLTVIIPSAVSGPMLSEDVGNSNQFIHKLINGTTRGVVNLSIGWTDVRDVARAHIEALHLETLDGERIILCERTMWVREIVQTLKDNNFSGLPAFTWPNFIFQFSLFQTQSTLDRKMIGKKRVISNAKSLKFFTWKFIDARQSIIETAKQLQKMNLK